MNQLVLGLLMLTTLVTNVRSQARETYNVPIVPVTNNPFEALYQYPMEGNGFKENGTHVFWPNHRKIFSKFYINMKYENETLFGISEQNFRGLLSFSNIQIQRNHGLVFRHGKQACIC